MTRFELKRSEQNCMAEWSFPTKKEYADPFNEVDLSAVFTDPDGEEKLVYAFWAGGNTWRFRYASPKVGRHYFRTICSKKSDTDLNGQEGILEVIPYHGENPLLKHGSLRVSQTRRYLEHIDGTPFFWLADTWWLGLTNLLEWPEGFKSLAADRVEKGFSVIQIVPGLPCGMFDGFDPRGANEAGGPWEEKYSRINPAFYDMADRRLDWLVQNGLLPCIFGPWGHFIDQAGEETMKKHWRNLVARYSAYPVVWSLSGEAVMLPYLSRERKDPDKKKEYTTKARASWTRVTSYLRSIDPYHHPVTIHPTSPDHGRNMVDDPSLLDIDMLQTGHTGYMSFPVALDMLEKAIAESPRMPVVNGEPSYEGIFGSSWEDLQRLQFWAFILSGAMGHTYGATGIWEFNSRKELFGLWPGGGGNDWGEVPWEEAYQYPGSRQLGLGKRLLERYPWWRFEPHPEWVEDKLDPSDPKGAHLKNAEGKVREIQEYFKSYVAGIPKEVRIIYLSRAWASQFIKVRNIEKDISYHAFYFNPRNGKEYDLGKVVPDKQGEWQPPASPIIQDWVLVMEAKR